MPKRTFSDEDLLGVLYLASGAIRDDEDLQAVLAMSVHLEDPRDRREILYRAQGAMRRVA
jgi:hypothetical protein